MKFSKMNIIRNALSIYIISVIFLGISQIVNAQGKVAEDAKGIVLGASVARSEKESISKLPVETYFGSSNLSNVNDQLSEQKVTVFAEDIISTFPDPELKIGSVIRVTRATPIKIVDAGKEAIAYTWVNTIKDLLAEKVINIGQDDKVNPPPESVLTPNLTVNIIRVEITKLTTKEPVDFKKIIKDDPMLDKGTSKIQQAGKKGERVKLFEVRRENGAEVSRKLLENKVTKDQIDEIALRGTKEVVYGTGKATWFSAPAMSAAHNSLPKGTMVEVKNLVNGKTVVVKIIGGGIMGSAIIDLSPDAFAKLSPLGTGVIQVRLTKS